MTISSIKFQICLLAISAPALILGKFPCPNDADILPCVCIEDPLNYNMDIDCSEIQDNDQLVNVFQATFPFPDKMNKFSIIKTSDSISPITELPEGVFGDVKFKFIYIDHSNLFNIGDNVFDKMGENLEVIEISNTNLTLFPFDHITKLTNLQKLALPNNKIKVMSSLRSNSLAELDVSGNDKLFFGGDEFEFAPHLESIKLSNCGLETIMPDMFSTQTNLSRLDLSKNKLEKLETDDFHFKDKMMTVLNLNDNLIAKIDIDTFTGLSDEFVIQISNNKLTTIEESVWIHVFETANNGPGTEQIHLQGNPIVCGCDLKWIAANKDFYDEFHQDTTCEDGVKLIESLDVIYNLC